MKERILGIDTGTNSLGWAIVDYDAESTGDKYTLIDKGVNIFDAGVKEEKGVEQSRAAERTDHKHLRVGYWRRKVRKVSLLRVLREAGLCPDVSDAELKRWRKEGIYPQNDDFMLWQRTDEEEGVNPYRYRHLCTTTQLDMTQTKNRYIVGRAIYHINQRRGFLSNRKEETREKDDGKVKQSIGEIDAAMAECGCQYLGEYFYQLYQRGEKIRSRYTDRLKHYEKELLAVCQKQGLDKTLTDRLRKVVITQRPLKSQKHTVGHCVFEKNKSRCHASHPLFEQFRMYSFVCNIKMQTPADDALRPLTAEERQRIIPKFMRKSKSVFNFEDIARELAGGGKNTYGYYKDKVEYPYRFNYHMDTSVSGCPVTAALNDVFEVQSRDNVDAWIDAASELYTQSQGKNQSEIMNDVWHALYFFDDEERLKNFAKEKLQLDDKHAKDFANIKMPQDYARVSLCAIRKILPYMKHYGMIYPHAATLGKLIDIIPSARANHDELYPMLPEEDARDIVEAFGTYQSEYLPRYKDGEERMSETQYIKTHILRKYGLPDDLRLLDKLYHHSMIETFPHVTAENKAKGVKLLGSPRTDSVRNPMAMHSLFRLRHVINTLLAKQLINEETKVHIEFARELNDANRRDAIRSWQNDQEKQKKTYADAIRKELGASYDPNETDILKYKLWEEQKGLCLYTGKTISIAELLDSNRFDIEHTIPRSVGGDSTNANLTVCDSRFNRAEKRAKLPSQLPNHELILERIDHWRERAAELSKQIRKLNTKGVTDKDTKDKIIRKRHKLIMERDYWQGKYARFTMTEVPEGFARRQGVDISVISKYGKSYLKSLFRHVSMVKGVTTAEFRKVWGVQEEHEKKARVNHCHHTIDAITIACIGKAEYDRLAQHYRNEDQRKWSLEQKRDIFPKPWKTFAEDMKQIEQSILVAHYTKDAVTKNTRKRNPDKKNSRQTGLFIQGDTARGALHQDTYYGAIERNGEVRYVKRCALTDLDEKGVNTIVDDEVRSKVQAAIDKYGSAKEAFSHPVWMNEEKGVEIKRVRCYANSIKRPLDIREHRDVSTKEYKRTFHVANDSNYLMAIYEGKTAKGKTKRDFELVNCLETTRQLRHSNRNSHGDLVPSRSANDYPLRWKLKVGMMVLLYEKDEQEVYECNAAELTRRLYKIKGMSSQVVSGYHYGNLTLIHHQDAHNSTEIKLKNGAYKMGEEFRIGIAMLHTQFNALVQGQDFTIDDTGEIVFKHR